MLKKFISLFLVVSITMSLVLVSSVSAQELTAEDVVEQAAFLQKLEIIRGISDKTSVSRAEFAVMAAKVFYNSMESADKRYFVDVPDDHWAAAAINTLVAHGIISQPEDKIFRMYDEITANEAIKIVLSMCGYDDYAQQIGGFPVGYSNVARRMGINVKASNIPLTPYEAYDLLYQALKLPLYEINGIMEDVGIFSQSKETLLSVYFDIYMAEGLVSQASGVSIYKNKVGEYKDIADYVVIDDVTYTTEISLYDYIGRTATVFYCQPDKNIKPHIIYRETTGREGDVIEIAAKNFVDYSNYVISYIDGQSGRAKKVNLNTGVKVIKNGAVCNTNLERDITVNKGFIRVVDQDEKNGADYVFISDYTNIVAGIINTETFTVYDKVTGNGKIELDPEEKAVFIENTAGAKLDFANITAGNVLTVFESAEYVRVIVSAASVTADIFGIKATKGVQLIEVGKSESDRKWLEIDKDYYNAVFKANGHGTVKLAAGAEITYYTDAYGNVAYITEPIKDNWTFAYLIGVAEGKESFSPRTKVKMFMQSGEMLVADVAEKVRVDEELAENYAALCAKLHKGNRQGKTLQTGEDEVVGQLIRVKLNGKDEVSAIDTEYVNPAEDKYSLKRTVDYGTPGYWWHSDSFPDVNLYCNAKTLKFAVPIYSQQLSVEDRYYMLRTSKYDTTQTSTLTVEGFKTDLSMPCASVIVDYVDFSSQTLKTTENAFMVENIIEKMNSTGDVIYAVSVCATDSGDMVEYTAEDKSVFAGLEKGDLIQLKMDAMGKVAGFEMLYDYGNPEFSISWGHLTNSGAWRQSDMNIDLVHSYVKTNSESDNILRLVWTRPLTETDMSYENINFAERFLGYKPGGPLIKFDGENITVTTLGEGIFSAEITGVGEDIQDYWFSVYLTAAVSGVVYTD